MIKIPGYKPEVFDGSKNNFDLNKPQVCIDIIRSFPVSEEDYQKIRAHCEEQFAQNKNPPAIWRDILFLVVATQNKQLTTLTNSYLESITRHLIKKESSILVTSSDFEDKGLDACQQKSKSEKYG